MGSNLSSRVNCSDIRLYKKYCKSGNRRPAIKIDKSKIGAPTDFQHTYHVGNSISPVSIDLLDNSNTMDPTTTAATTTATDMLTDNDFLATMAQITDALKMFPANNNYSLQKSLPNHSTSDQHLPLQQLSEKEKRSIIHMSKSTSQLAVNQGKHDFSSGLQSRIDAQIVQLARARSKQKRPPRNNNDNNNLMLCDRPTIMI